MKSKKLINPDGTTNKIIVLNDSGSYSAYTPRQAAQMINELSKQLWSGLPMNRKFTEMRQGS